SVTESRKGHIDLDDGDGFGDALDGSTLTNYQIPPGAASSKAGWYLGNAFVSDTDANTIYYRSTILLNIKTQRVLKPNGTPYAIDLHFAVFRAEGATTGSGYPKMRRDGTPQSFNGAVGLPTFRVFTDGGTVSCPIPIGNLHISTLNLAGGAQTP